MEVTRITFQADEQNLVKTGGLDVFASDTVSYIEAEFSLGTNWTGFDSVRAMWKFGSDVYSTVLDHEGKCIVPWEVLTKRGELKVNLVGSIVENDVLTDRLTTFPVIALIISKIAQVEGENTAEITPSEFEQFVAVVNDDADRAEDAKDDAVAAKNAAELAQQRAEDAQALAESARDSAQGYAQDAQEASQSILGLQATASVDANVGTPNVNVSVSEVGGNKVMDFDFHNLKGVQGETGATGADGFSPIVTTTPIEGGTEVDIEDAQGHHTFNVLNGDVSNFYSFLPTDSASGSIASFPDGANNIPMESLVAEIEPIQDLNGQDSPYPAGGGANKWDEEWEVGAYDATTGEPISGSGQIRSKNDILVNGMANVYIATPTYNIRPIFLDTNKAFISAPTAGKNYVVTVPNNAVYMRFYTGSGYGTTYNHDISINYPSTDTSYHPYSNICPISGRTEVETVRVGKNLFDKSTIVVSERWNASGTASVGDYAARSPLIRVKPSTSYYFKNVIGAATYSAVWWYDKDLNNVGYNAWSGSTGNPASGTAQSPATAYYVGINLYTENKDTTMMTEGSTAPTSYIAYQSNTITTELGQTVYGGTLDVVSGVLTVTGACVTYDGSSDEGWTAFPYGSASAYAMRATLPSYGKSGDSPNVMSANYLPTLSVNATWGNYDVFISKTTADSSNQILTGIRSITTVDAWKTYLSQNPLQVFYELATPITVQLTPTEVRTLLGTNNLWSDSGDTSVTYKADIQKYIDKQISAVLNA